MSEGRLIGDAYIAVLAQTSDFRSGAEEGIRRALLGIDPKVPVGADTVPFLADVEAAREAILGANGGKIDLYVGANTAGAQRGIAEMLAEGELLRDRLKSIPITTDDNASIIAMRGMGKDIDELLTKMGYFSRMKTVPQLHLDTFDNELRRAMMSVEALDTKFAHLGQDFDVDSAITRLALMRAQVIDISAGLKEMEIDPGDYQGRAKLLSFQAQVMAVAKELRGMKVDADTLPMEAKLAGLTAQTRKWQESLAEPGGGGDVNVLTSDVTRLSSALKSADKNATSASRSTMGLGFAGYALSAIWSKIPHEIELFGGALGDLYGVISGGKELASLPNHLLNVATGFHLGMEAAIEFTAVWGPALITLTAFGIAAIPTVKGIYDQIVSLRTASMATGDSLDGLGKSGKSLADWVKPSVLEAFGEGLVALDDKSSNTGKMLAGLGAGIDQLVAQAAVAFDSKAGGTFFQTGSSDALELMHAFANLGSVLGAFMRVVPGYAEELLQFGTDFLGMTAKVANNRWVDDVLGGFLKLHGAIFYGGLAGTFAATIFGKLVGWGETAALKIASIGVAIQGEESIIAAGALNVGGFLEGIGSGPVIAAIALATGAVVGLYMYLKSGTTAAEQFGKTLQSQIGGAAIGDLWKTMKTGAAEATNEIAAAHKQLQAAGTMAPFRTANFSSGQLASATAASGAIRAYESALANVRTEQVNYNSNLNTVAKTLGVTLPQALGILTGAQVTSNELTTKSTANTAQLIVMAQGYQAQLRTLTPSIGAYGQAVNALNITSATQVTDATNLGSAYATLFGILTGGQTGFISYVQNLRTLGTDAKKAKDNLTGTSAASLTAASDFITAASSAQALYSSLQTQAAVAGNSKMANAALTKSGKDMIAMLLSQTHHSQQLTSYTYGLAQSMGYLGKDSYAGLVKWAGKAKTATGDLNTQQQILAASVADLTQDAKNLSAALGTALTSAEASAIFQAEGGQKAFNNFATALKHTGAESKTTQQWGEKVVQMLMATTGNAQQAEGQFEAMTTQMGLSKGASDKLWNSLYKTYQQLSNAQSAAGRLKSQLQQITDRDWVVKVNVTGITGITAGNIAPGVSAGSVVGSGPPVFQPHRTGASGALVRGSGPSGKDSSLYMLAPGEAIVPTSHVAKYAPMFKRDGIPGFSSGGVAGASSSPFTSASQALSSLLTGSMFGYSGTALDPLLNPAESAVTGPQMQPMTQGQGMTMLQLLQQLVKVMQGNPQALAQALNSSSGNGARKAWGGI